MTEPPIRHEHHHDFGVSRFVSGVGVAALIFGVFWTLVVMVLNYPWFFLGGVIILSVAIVTSAALVRDKHKK